MAGLLPISVEKFKPIPGATIAIIASMWHADIIDSMISAAQRGLVNLGVKNENLSIHRLPGSLELPYAADMLFNHHPKLDLIIAFGVILKGITNHDQTVMQNVVNGFSLVTHTHKKPIINEVIGVESLEDAWKRAGDDHANKGVEAVFATSEVYCWKNSLIKPLPI